MKVNKALVKHETRNMKWMLLYFLLVSIGGVLYLRTSLDSEYMEVLRRGITPDRSIILSSIRYMLNSIMVPMGIGILLMIYLQFKDSKSVEVGNFLKALPINNREYFTTKFIGGLISLTIPTVVLIVGVILVRNSTTLWVSDVYSISKFPELLIKGDSIINIASIFIMSYLVAVSTYAFLFMIQYIVMSITAGLVIGILVWLSPMFIIMTVFGLYRDFIEKATKINNHMFIWTERFFNYFQPWTYPGNLSHFSPNEYNPAFDNMEFLYYEGLVTKIIVVLVITIVSVAVGYILSKKSRVEDSETLITFKWARKVFVIGVTVCSALLVGSISQVFFGRFNSIGFLMTHIILLVGAILGFLISRKITMVKSK